MRIVDRKTFLTLPAGTLYAKVSADPSYCIFQELCIKGDSMINDWLVQTLVGDFNTADDTSEIIQAWDDMRAGGDREIDFDYAGRDGFFDEDEMFAVFSRADHVALIQRLVEALGDTANA